MLFSAEAGGHPALLFLLVEHQSSVEPLMAYRVLRYVTRIWDRWLREHPTAQRLPRLVPMVVYAGEDPWNAPTAVEDLIEGASEEAWLPRMRFILDDLSHISDQALSARQLNTFGDIALRALLRLPRNPDPVRTLRSWAERLLQLLRGHDGLSRLAAVLAYLARVANVEWEDVQRLVRELSPLDEEKVMTTLAERIEQDALVKGREEGREEGRRQAQAEMTLRLLHKRFGELPKAVLVQVEAGADADFERWSERILLAQNLDQVFDDSSLS